MNPWIGREPGPRRAWGQAAEVELDELDEADEPEAVPDEAAGFASDDDEADVVDDEVPDGFDDAGELLDDEPRLSFR